MGPRGHPNEQERVPQGPAETATQANTRVYVTGVSGLAAQPVAGQMLWLTDESGSGLIACRLAWAVLNPPWVVGIGATRSTTLMMKPMRERCGVASGPGNS